MNNIHEEPYEWDPLVRRQMELVREGKIFGFQAQEDSNSRRRRDKAPDIFTPVRFSDLPPIDELGRFALMDDERHLPPEQW